MGQSQSDMTEANAFNYKLTSMEGTELTGKKQQYLDQDIEDKRGLFKYTKDPSTYKKARKRLQNRESAVRSRKRKADQVGELLKEVTLLKKERV